MDYKYMDYKYIKIKELNKDRLDYFCNRIITLEDDSLEYLANNKLNSNRHVTGEIKLRKLKCKWLCGALPNHILFRLSVKDEDSYTDIEFLRDVMKARGYNLIILDYKEYAYVFEKTIDLGDNKEELKPNVDKLASEYAIFNSEQCIYSESKGWETDYDAIYKAFIAGYMANNKEKTK